MRRRRLLLAAGVLLLLWVAASAFLLLRAAGDLRAGRDAAERARDDLDARAVAAGTPLEPLREAERRFARAESTTGGLLLAPVRLLPVVGRQLRSVHALSGAAGEVAAAGAEAVDRAQAVLDDPAAGGPARVTQVRLIRDTVRRASERIAAVDDLGPRVGLVGPLAEARNDLAEELDDARRSLADATAGAEAALRLVEGPRRYLLVAANNAEMRSGSGMWLSGGLLTTAAGRIDLGDVTPLYLDADPPDDAVEITDADLAGRWGWMNPQREWRSLMGSPRLAPSAELAVRMWEAAGREPVSGVLVVDPVALAAIVRATGEVAVGDRTVSADEVPALLLNEQYADFDTEGDQGARREALGAIASAAFEALDEGDWSPAVLLEELAAAVRGRHLLAWSTDPVEQAGWEAAGMDGALTPDSLMVSVVNRGGNKLDWFLDVDVALTREGDDVEVRVDLANRAVPGLPAYVAGPHPDLRGELGYGDYKGVVALTLPGDATGAAVDGSRTVSVRGADGPAQVLGLQVVVPAGEARSVSFRFRRTTPARPLRVEPSARFPTTTWTAGDRSWDDDEPVVLPPG